MAEDATRIPAEDSSARSCTEAGPMSRTATAARRKPLKVATANKTMATATAQGAPPSLEASTAGTPPTVAARAESTASLELEATNASSEATTVGR